MPSPGCLDAYRNSRVQVKFSHVVEGLKKWLSQWIPASMVLPLFSIFTVGLIFAVVGPVFAAYQRTTGKATSGTSVYCGLQPGMPVTDVLHCKEYNQLSDDNVTDKPLVLFLKSRFTGLDLQAGTATLVTDVSTYGDLGNDQGELDIPVGVNLTVIIGSQTVDYQKGDRPDRITTSLDLKADKSLYQYPFDNYKSNINYKAFLRVGSSMTVFVPVIAQVDTGLPSFNIQSDESSQSRHALITPNVTQVFTSVKLERSIATKFFSIFIVIAMWALSASTLVFVVDLVYVRPHVIATDDLAFVAGVLFALPGVRNVQPGVPDGGASVDVLGYFWNMAIVVISACLALAGMMGQYIVRDRERALVHGGTEDIPLTEYVKSHHQHAAVKLIVEPEAMH